MEEIRLNKYIAESGICSRREADKLIQQGLVLDENKNMIEIGSKVSRNTIIYVDGKKLEPRPTLIYIVLNKPRGITCTTELNISGNIIDFVKHDERIFPIGRLDKDSEGLILLTNDGDIVNRILRNKNNHEKEYIVTVNRKITPSFLQKMGNGVRIEDGLTNKCLVEIIDDFTFKIVLTQGMNRQIRKMCEHFEYTVIKLKRIRIMHITIDQLDRGQWRNLTSNELDMLLFLTKDSEKNH